MGNAESSPPPGLVAEARYVCAVYEQAASSASQASFDKALSECMARRTQGSEAAAAFAARQASYASLGGATDTDIAAELERQARSYACATEVAALGECCGASPPGATPGGGTPGIQAGEARASAVPAVTSGATGGGGSGSAGAAVPTPVPAACRTLSAALDACVGACTSPLQVCHGG